MSCVAEANEIASNSAEMAPTDGDVAIAASAPNSSASRTWVTRIHPRLRPRNGGHSRSISGAQANLNE
jgi:hypothetical protein